MTNALIAWRPTPIGSPRASAYGTFGISITLHAVALAIAAATGYRMEPAVTPDASTPLQVRLMSRPAVVPPENAARPRAAPTAPRAAASPTTAQPVLPEPQAAPPLTTRAPPVATTEATPSTPAPADPAPDPVPIATPREPSPIAPTASIAPAAAPITLPHTNAAYLDNPRPTYPSAARRLRLEGTVVLRVLVAASGRPDRVEIGASSGAELLDRAALEAVRAWRFVPARLGEEAIAHAVDVPIRFRLADA